MLDKPQAAATDFELMLARAFDLAFEKFLQVEGESENTPENRGSLAARIVVLGKLGEPDEEEISAAAVIYLRALAAAKRLDRPRVSAATVNFGSAGTTLNQEAIDAASGALEACLEELPEGIHASARSVLSHSIMENAGKGERNGDRLRELALDALKSRR
jgi:hypothetical protein